jgi:hypothetical protein
VNILSVVLELLHTKTRAGVQPGALKSVAAPGNFSFRYNQTFPVRVVRCSGLTKEEERKANGTSSK